MRVSSFPPVSPVSSGITPHPIPAPLFSTFSPQAFSLAVKRSVPVFLLISDTPNAIASPSVFAHLAERTVPVHLYPGQRPDVELLCRRTSFLYSGEDSLPLCALLMDNALPFLAAPLPPYSFETDPSRLLIWLTHADRRFSQNRAAFRAQAMQVLRSFDAAPLTKPYSPHDAAHDLLRALLSAQDTINGGFGKIKSPHAPFLSFLSREAARSSHDAHTILDHALDAMKNGALHDPIDGLYFCSTLTEDWRVFIPQKPLAINVLISQILMRCGRKEDAVRTLDALVDRFPFSSGLMPSALNAPKSRYAFSCDQIVKILGSEEGLRACRLLGLLHQRRSSDPDVAPSRFSPPIQKHAPQRPLDQPRPPLYPTLCEHPVPEDAAFLRRIYPILQHARAAREREEPLLPPLTLDCALTAAVLTDCAKRTGESRYAQIARRTVSALLSFMPNISNPGALPPTLCSAAHFSEPTCGASAALSLALLTLAAEDPAYTPTGLRLLGSTLHAFVREDGMVMHTPSSQNSLPRVPAIYDNTLPSPAALLARALKKAQQLRPDVPYSDALESLWHAAAPYVRHNPMACASLIDAMNDS